MGFFNKINKIVKESLDIDLEKEAKELLKDNIGDVKSSLGDLLSSHKDAVSEVKKIFSESLGEVKDSLSDVLGSSPRYYDEDNDDTDDDTDDDEYDGTDDDDDADESENDSRDSYAERMEQFRSQIYNPFSSSSASSSSSSKKSASKKAAPKNDYIYTVKNGCVHILSKNGGQARAPFHPSSGGDAMTVDYNPDLDLLVITTVRGQVMQYKETGSQASGFCVYKAVNARWQGNDILVEHEDGSKILYNIYGAKIKYY